MNSTTLLLVEDDVSIAELYATKLRQHYASVTKAVNGLDALHKLKSGTPALILLDLKMPVMGGEEFLRKLRQKEKYADIPVLILTNISKSEAPKTLWHYGVSGYYVKAHHTPAELVELVGETLAQHAESDV